MKNKWKGDYLFLAVGAVLAACSIETLLKPNNIMDGGVVGISMILSYITAWKLGILTLIINVPFVFLGYKELGKHFLFKTVFSMVVFSVALEFAEKWNPVTEDGLLATVFGGMLLGVGVGLVLKYGGCLDGTETLAILISKKTTFSIGQFVLICNVIIYSIAGFIFGIESTMYSLLTYFLASKVMDSIQEGLNQAKSVMIITDDYEGMVNAIYQKIGRTVTIMEGNGLISGKKAVLYCVVTRLEIPELKNVIKEQDVSAFVTVTDVSEIIGNHIKSSGEV